MDVVYLKLLLLFLAVVSLPSLFSGNPPRLFTSFKTRSNHIDKEGKNTDGALRDLLCGF